VVCEGIAQLEKYKNISKELPNLKAIVVYGISALSDDVKDQYSVKVYTFEEFCELGGDIAVSDDDLKARSSSWKPGETCTLIYTSGKFHKSGFICVVLSYSSLKGLWWLLLLIL